MKMKKINKILPETTELISKLAEDKQDVVLQNINLILHICGTEENFNRALKMADEADKIVFCSTEQFELFATEIEVVDGEEKFNLRLCQYIGENFKKKSYASLNKLPGNFRNYSMQNVGESVPTSKLNSLKGGLALIEQDNGPDENFVSYKILLIGHNNLAPFIKDFTEILKEEQEIKAEIKASNHNADWGLIRSAEQYNERKKYFDFFACIF